MAARRTPRSGPDRAPDRQGRGGRRGATPRRGGAPACGHVDGARPRSGRLAAGTSSETPDGADECAIAGLHGDIHDGTLRRAPVVTWGLAIIAMIFAATSAGRCSV